MKAKLHELLQESKEELNRLPAFKKKAIKKNEWNEVIGYEASTAVYIMIIEDLQAILNNKNPLR